LCNWSPIQHCTYLGGTETRTYNSLSQITGVQLGTQTNVAYYYNAGANNGQIATTVDSAHNQTVNYSYDALKDPETKVQICTIQGLVKRVLDPGGDGLPPPIDPYDLMVIDECHRGYLLDREMSDAGPTQRAA
jgi:type I site-specific restriction endonuclease